MAQDQKVIASPFKGSRITDRRPVWPAEYKDLLPLRTKNSKVANLKNAMAVKVLDPAVVEMGVGWNFEDECFLWMLRCERYVL
ncbi:hypothetical protein CDAR_231421 [Caerostris darwini]|uniref:Uncharacterized protein n=1 Tax=Caerostris darwini TaxID=1538125 RepID=A0AAV4PL35_9ARAC|nr:hypothetical protein CDAR_231421 [Caerostris darwini]